MLTVVLVVKLFDEVGHACSLSMLQNIVYFVLSFNSELLIWPLIQRWWYWFINSVNNRSRRLKLHSLLRFACLNILNQEKVSLLNVVFHYYFLLSDDVFDLEVLQVHIWHPWTHVVCTQPEMRWLAVMGYLILIVVEMGFGFQVMSVELYISRLNAIFLCLLYLIYV